MRLSIFSSFHLQGFKSQGVRNLQEVTVRVISQQHIALCPRRPRWCAGDLGPVFEAHTLPGRWYSERGVFAASETCL